MLFKILLVSAVVGLSQAGPPDYSETSRGQSPSYATPSPTPFSSDSPFHSAEAKSYKEDDRRHYGDGPSHPRTGPPKKLGPGPLSYSGGGVPLVPAHRGGYLPPGAVIGYLAYPQPLPLHAEPVAHHSHGLLPSAAFSHIAYAAPIALSPYHKPLPLAPSYSSGGPSYSSGGPSYSSGGPSYSSGATSYSSAPSYNSHHSSYK